MEFLLRRLSQAALNPVPYEIQMSAVVVSAPVEKVRLVFQPDGENTVALPGDGTLAPMVLQPLFEDAA